METEIERYILKELLFNEIYFGKVYSILDGKHFEMIEFQTVFSYIKKFVTKHNKSPNIKEFVLYLQNSEVEENTKTQIKETLQGLISDEAKIDVNVLLKETEEFVQKAELKEAILKSVDIIQGGGDFDEITRLILNAQSVKIDSDLGIDVFNDLQKKYEFYTKLFKGYLTGIEPIDNTLGGGFKEKTLSVVLSPSHGGKSTFLMALAGNYATRKLDVVYFTLEMPEESVSRRIDSNIIRTPSNDIDKMSFDEYKNKFPKELGNLFVKEFSSGSLSVLGIKTYLKELFTQKGKTPKIIIIDYLSLLKSDRVSLSKAGGYLYYKAIAEELHGFAKEYGVAVITAQQLGRSAFDNIEAGADEVADSIGVIQTADIAFGLLSNETLRGENQVIVNFWKNRYTGLLDKYPLNVDYSMATYWATDEANTMTKQVEITTPKAGDGFKFQM